MEIAIHHALKRKLCMKKPAILLTIFLLIIVIAGQSFAGEKSSLGLNKKIRLAVVNTPQFSGLLNYLLPDFEETSGYYVDVYSGNDVYERARQGEADLVISHYGKHQLETFVLEGYGSWPKTVFSNQAAIIGPKSDPAEIKGEQSASVAFSKIAETNSYFIDNPIPTASYLTNTLWELAGQPDKHEWFLHKPDAVNVSAAHWAEEQSGYFIWGASPFLKYQEKARSNMEIMVSADPILQRIMSATFVNPNKFVGINSDGAKALLSYLLAPQTQAKIINFREEGSDKQLWWPAGWHN